MTVAGGRGAKWVGSAVVAMAAMVGLGHVAEAGTLKLTWDSSTSTGYEASPGGEFKVYDVVNPDGVPLGVQATPPRTNGTGTFQTFCIEYNEYLQSKGATYIWSITTGATNGGVSGQDPLGGNFDPLDARTAYLYHEFWTGQLNDYDWLPLGTTRIGSARSLQRAIWFLEGELGASYTLASLLALDSQAHAWVVEATSAVAVGGSWYTKYYDAGTGKVGIGDVRVLHLTKMDGSASQDQLVVVVPLPSAAWGGLGLLAGLGAVGAIRRRNRSVLA